MSHPAIDAISQQLGERYPQQPVFLQAACEVLETVGQYYASVHATKDTYDRIARLLEPDRIINFKVVWVNDAGALEHNTGYRVQYNRALGPYKGGLRFDPSVNEDVLKFLAFEQIFKNALTGLPLGGAKGGSNFNPKGRSDNEIRSFCQAFMIELHRHIGMDIDVPAGDIGVSGREIGYLYGAYVGITNRNEGVLTGKNELFGGSCRRTEATGHGVVYIAERAAKEAHLSFDGMRSVVSGSGNVAEFTARKLIERGVTVLTLSDRNGYLYKAVGFSQTDIDAIAHDKQKGNTLADSKVDGATYRTGTPWQHVVADAYFPCATQNEVDEVDAQAMIQTAQLIVEGANMPLTDAAAKIVRSSSVVYVPGKAANAGGVAVSGLEMAQNASHLPWECDRVETELKNIMHRIHSQCVEYGKRENGFIDYVRGANLSGFFRVISAMEKLGW